MRVSDLAVLGLAAAVAVSPHVAVGQEQQQECEGPPCSDKTTPVMQEKRKPCFEFPNVIRTKCNKAYNWTQKQYCAQTCYEAGHGYDGYYGSACCPVSGMSNIEAPRPIPTPSFPIDDSDGTVEFSKQTEGVANSTASKVNPKEPFQLMMFYDPKFNWQGTTKRRRWCITCSSGGGGSCDEGDSIRLDECDGDKERQLWLRVGDSIVSYTDQKLAWDYRAKEFELRRIGSSKYQDFIAGRGEFSLGGGWDEVRYSFELHPGKKRGSCATQRHHPRSREQLLSLPCDRARKHDTALYVAVSPGNIDGHRK